MPVLKCGLRVTSHLCCMLAGVIASLGLASAADATPPALKHVAQTQIVNIDGENVLFSASVLVCGNQADGLVTIEYASGEVLELIPVGATLNNSVSEEVPTAVLVLLPPLDGSPAAIDIVRAAVSPIPDDPACQLWDFTGSTVQGGPVHTRLTFIAEGDWSASRERCRPHDYGLPVRATLKAPRQRVQPLDGGDPFEFAAQIAIDRDNTAMGFISFPLAHPGSVYQTFFGAVLRSAETGVVFVTCSAFPDASSTDDTLVAVGTPVASTTNPDCLIWNLENGSSGETPPTYHTATFDAETYWKLSGQKSK